MRQVAQIMGMPITIDIPKAKDKAVFKAAFERLRQIDARFSTYKSDSEVSRYGRGEIAESNLSGELQQVIQACAQAKEQTNGYFDVWATGQLDTNGYVKGWAIAEAGIVIEKSGYKTYCLSAGGDVLARSSGEKDWNIGIQDPANPVQILNKLSISNGAVCTSGNYARGAHIVNPTTGQASDFWASVTVTGPDIICADVLATACFAMGPKAPEFMKTQKDYDLIAYKN